MARLLWISTSSGSFNTAANFYPAAAPASGDVIDFELPNRANVTANLATGLAALTLNFHHTSGTEVGTYTAGAPAYLSAGILTANVGMKPAGSPASGGTGSRRIMLQGTNGASPSPVTVYDTHQYGPSDEGDGTPPLQLLGTNVSLAQKGGRVGVGIRAGETAGGTFRVSAGAAAVVAPALLLGDGVTVADLNMQGGEVLSRSTNAAADVSVNGGTYTYQGTGAHTLLTVSSGAVAYYDGTGTLTMCHLHGALRFGRDPRAKTVTNITVYDGYELDTDNGVSGGIVFTNDINWLCGVHQGTYITPAGIKFKPVAI